jgi:hypothetical protein
MAYWTVSTQQKKSVEEHELWQKDDFVIRRITGFRFGTWSVETNDDEVPVLNQDSGPSGDAINMNEYFDENVESIEMEMLDDGWYADVIWPDDMPDDERERLEELWEEDSYSAWEGEGWVNYETECWASGPLDIKKAE